MNAAGAQDPNTNAYLMFTNGDVHCVSQCSNIVDATRTLRQHSEYRTACLYSFTRAIATPNTGIRHLRGINK